MIIDIVTPITTSERSGKIHFGIIDYNLGPRELRKLSALSTPDPDKINVHLDQRFCQPQARELITRVFHQPFDLIHCLSDVPASMLVDDPWTLTSTELSLASFRFLGKSTEDLAVERTVSTRTIEKHFENLRNKLGITSLNSRALLLCHLCWVCSQRFNTGK